MADHERKRSSQTPLRPEPETANVWIIDADGMFSQKLGQILSAELPKMVRIVGNHDGIPDSQLVYRETHLVVFDPELDDFRILTEAVRRMRNTFGSSAMMAAHSDAWNVADNRLRLELLAAGVEIGFKRYDIHQCIKLVTKIAMREPYELWYKEFLL